MFLPAHFLRGVATSRTPDDESRLALASLMDGAVARFRFAVEVGDELAQKQALADMDALRIKALEAREQRAGLLFKCDECHENFPANQIVVGGHSLCQWCAA